MQPPLTRPSRLPEPGWARQPRYEAPPMPVVQTGPMYVSPGQPGSLPVYVHPDRRSVSPVHAPAEQRSGSPAYRSSMQQPIPSVPAGQPGSLPVYVNPERRSGSPVHAPTYNSPMQQPVSTVPARRSGSPVHAPAEQRSDSPSYRSPMQQPIPGVPAQRSGLPVHSQSAASVTNQPTDLHKSPRPTHVSPGAMTAAHAEAGDEPKGSPPSRTTRAASPTNRPISVDRLSAASSHLEGRRASPTATRLFDLLDTDQDGLIDRHEFSALSRGLNIITEKHSVSTHSSTTDTSAIKASLAASKAKIGVRLQPNPAESSNMASRNRMTSSLMSSIDLKERSNLIQKRLQEKKKQLGRHGHCYLIADTII